MLDMRAVFDTINYVEWKDLKTHYCYTDKFLPGLNLRYVPDCFHQRNFDQSRPFLQLLLLFVLLQYLPLNLVGFISENINIVIQTTATLTRIKHLTKLKWRTALTYSHSDQCGLCLSCKLHIWQITKYYHYYSITIMFIALIRFGGS